MIARNNCFIFTILDAAAADVFNTLPGLHFFEGKPDRLAELDKMRADDAVARKLVELRTKADLTQRELAKLVGTSASVICRLEDADYEGHSLAMLNRLAAALHRRVEIRFMPLRGV